MSQKFNKVTTTSNFIKNLLASTYLPLIKTVRDTDYIIKGRLYVYKCEVIMCTKSGYIITGYKNAGDKRPRASFEQRAEYFFGERNDKLCTNYISNSAGYDYLTHERLGKYLRGLRDMYGLNLMPLYNCFSNQPLPRHHIYNDRIISTGLNFNTKVFKVPIRFNTDYTICMENLGMTTFAPAFVKNNNLLLVDNTEFGNGTDLTNKYLKLHREGVVINRPNLRFKNPLVLRFNNIPETKTIKYYLQEDRIIDINEDRWYKQVVAEEDEHLYVRTVDKDGNIIYKYYDFIPSLSPSEGLYPKDAEFSIDAEITEEIFKENKEKYFYVKKAAGILTYEDEETRDLVYDLCKEAGLVVEYNIKKGEEAYLVEDASSSIVVSLELLEYKVPEEEFEKAITKIVSASGVEPKSQLCNNEYTSCRNMETFDLKLVYYYVSKEGLFPKAGNQISAYRGINPSIGTFDSDVSIYTAVNLRRQCNAIMPYDAEANYYTIEGNFYVLVHPSREEYEDDPERFYLDNDFGGDPTNYFKLIPSTYLPPDDSLYPSEDLYPFDRNGKRRCRPGTPFDPNKDYYIYDEVSDTYILVKITEEEYNENPEMYYIDNVNVLVSNTLGKFVRCTSDERFNMNLTYAEMKRDSLSWREKKYTYNEVEISAASFNADKTRYFTKSESESWRISSGAPSNSYLFEKVLYPSIYRIDLAAPSTLKVNEEYTSAEASLNAIEINDLGYKRALLKVDMDEMPKGSNPKIIIDDGETEINLVETGQWGSAEGFEISKDFSTSIPLKLIFDKVGSYRTSFKIVDLDNDEAIVCKTTRAIEVVAEEDYIEEPVELFAIPEMDINTNEPKTVTYKLVDSITADNNYIIVDSKEAGHGNVMLFNDAEAPRILDAVIIEENRDVLINLTEEEESLVKLVALSENTFGYIDNDTTYKLRKVTEGSLLEFSKEDNPSYISIDDYKLKINNEFIYWSLPGYIQCTESDVFDAETQYFTQDAELVNTTDTWIHLDKEYYLQHPVIVENNYIYDITERNCSLYEEFENNLYLLIQVPEAFNSSIVILEGDYTNTDCKKIFNSSDVDILPESLLDYFFTSNLKLMEAASTEVIPFSDTLMEFLTWNAINGLDSINNNMDRIAILMNTVYPEPFKEAFRKNFWFPGYREAVYNMAKEHNIFHITDNLGYVTKDIEALLYNIYTMSDPGEKSLNMD